MSALPYSHIFTPGQGHYWTPHCAILDNLPAERRVAASEVMNAILTFHRQHRLDERITDRVLAQFLGRSRRFVQKGLKILQDLELIERIRGYGRRTIVVRMTLRGREEPQPKASSPKPTEAQPRRRKDDGPTPNVPPMPETTPAQAAANAAKLAEAEAIQAPALEAYNPDALLPEVKAIIDSAKKDAEANRKRDAYRLRRPE
jgi:hypothetical protein